MKKILFTILVSICSIFTGYSQMNVVMMEVTKNGASLSGGDMITSDGVLVVATHVAKKASVSTEATPGLGDANFYAREQNGMAIVNFSIANVLQQFGPVENGNEIKVYLEITKSDHPLKGWIGERTATYRNGDIVLVGTAGIELEAPPEPTISLNSVGDFCNNQTPTFTATVKHSSASVQWTITKDGSDAKSNFTIDGKDAKFKINAAAGDYIVKASVAGKSDTKNVTVKQQPSLTEITSNKPGATEVYTLSVTPTPSSAPLTWTPAASIASGAGTASVTTKELTGSVTFTVEANMDACKVSKTLAVGLDPGPDDPGITLPEDGLSFADGTPSGSDTKLTATVPDGSSNTITWVVKDANGNDVTDQITISGGTTADFSDLGEGEYTVTASTNGETSNEVTVTITGETNPDPDPDGGPVRVEMGEGIVADNNSDLTKVDGWYCKGVSISLKAIVDPALINPTYAWKIDGQPAGKEMGPDHSILSWVPEDYEDDVTVEVCVTSEGEKYCTTFLRLKSKIFVQPTLQIENNIQDTIACLGDSLLFRAIWTNAGSNPTLSWEQDLWNRGSGAETVMHINDKDTWVKCILTPGDNVCYLGLVADSMMIHVRENIVLTISTDMTDKRYGDELFFESNVEGLAGLLEYQWYVNGNYTIDKEDIYITDLLRQGDEVEASINGYEVCMNKIFSNTITIDYTKGVNRDTSLFVHTSGRIVDVEMLKEVDDVNSVVFKLEGKMPYGMASITPDGKFSYTPDSKFVGDDNVEYVVVDKLTKEVLARGDIHIRVAKDRFFIPNLITPNGDGKNDKWKLEFLKDYPDHKVLIFDRDQKLIFETTDFQDWDGRRGTKPKPISGVYNYVIELRDENHTVLKSWIEVQAKVSINYYR